MKRINSTIIGKGEGENDIKKVKNYFKEYIFGFIFNDIESCIKAKANYTVALALLS